MHSNILIPNADNVTIIKQFDCTTTQFVSIMMWTDNCGLNTVSKTMAQYLQHSCGLQALGHGRQNRASPPKCLWAWHQARKSSSESKSEYNIRIHEVAHVMRKSCGYCWKIAEDCLWKVNSWKISWKKWVMKHLDIVNFTWSRELPQKARWSLLGQESLGSYCLGAVGWG